MTSVQFTVNHDFDVPAQRLWDAMIDWPDHGRWIPATRVELDDETANTVGATFTGYTGYGPLTLEDRMRISEFEWDPTEQAGSCTVDKLGPVLTGTAGFTVQAKGAGSSIEWFEDVEVRYLPSVLGGIVTRLSASGFSFGMRRLAKLLAS